MPPKALNVQLLDIFPAVYRDEPHIKDSADLLASYVVMDLITDDEAKMLALYALDKLLEPPQGKRLSS